MSRALLASRRGFTLVEVLIATALLGFSLVVMFGFHAQAVRSNYHARKVTDCTYLAQGQLEELIAIDWETASGGARPPGLEDGDGSSDEWGCLYHPSQNGSCPSEVDSMGSTSQTDGRQKPSYLLTWEVDSMDAVEDTWVRLRVRCAYQDNTFNSWHGTTISTYRYRDP
jgi:prepilin-type N-terminal cleavage/methylation domain-containing protein